MGTSKKGVKFLAAFVALFVAGGVCGKGFAQTIASPDQATVPSTVAQSALTTKIAQRIATAPEVEKMLNDGSRLVASGWDKGVLVVYYTNDQTRLGFARQQDSKYKEAVQDMEVYDLVCFISADQHIVCIRPSDHGAKDVSKSLTKGEAAAMFEGFQKACGCEIPKADEQSEIQAGNPPVPKVPSYPQYAFRGLYIGESVTSSAVVNSHCSDINSILTRVILHNAPGGCNLQWRGDHITQIVYFTRENVATASCEISAHFGKPQPGLYRLLDSEAFPEYTYWKGMNGVFAAVRSEPAKDMIRSKPVILTMVVIGQK